MIVRCASARDRVRGLRHRAAIVVGTAGLAAGSVYLAATGQAAQAVGAGQDGLPAPLQVLAPTGGQVVSHTGRNIALIVAGLLVLAVIIFLIVLLRRRKDEDGDAAAPVVPPAGSDAMPASDASTAADAVDGSAATPAEPQASEEGSPNPEGPKA